MSLRKKDKADRIEQAVEEQICSGALAPGDPLLTYAELMRRYDVSQRVVERALQNLETRGLVVRKPRVGCFVREGAGVDTARPPAESKATAPALEPAGLVDFNPYHGHREVNVFLTDGYPAQLQAWRDIFAEFESRHDGLRVTYTSARNVSDDGNLRAAMAADLVQATPAVLTALGRHRFLPLAELESFGLPENVLVKPVQEYEQSTPALYGLPVQLTLPILFTNETLRGRYDVSVPAREGPAALARAILQARGQHPDATELWYEEDLGRALVHNGAIRIRPDLDLTYDRTRAEDVVSALVAFSTVDPPADTVLEPFMDNRLVCSVGRFLFLTERLRAEAPFPWTAIPTPRTPDAQAELIPLLVAVRRDTPWLPECLELMHLLATDSAQRRLTASGDCLPVRQDVLDAPETRQALPLHADDIAALLDQGSVLFDEQDANLKLERDLRMLGNAALRCRWTTDQVLGMIDELWTQYHDGTRNLRASEADMPHFASAVSVL